MKKIFILSALMIFTAQNAIADCSTYDTQMNQFRNKVGALQDNGTEAQVKQLVDEGNRIDAAAKKAGCTLKAPAGQPSFQPNVSDSDNARIRSEYTPSTPGAKDIVDDPTFNPLANLPKIKLPSVNFNFSAPNFNNSASNGNSTTPTNSYTCGEVASQYGDFLKNLSGNDKVTYKEGCAGTDADGKPRTSPDAPNTICTGNQFGKFGLIYGAYNNKSQSFPIDEVLAKTPALSDTPDVVAYNDTRSGNRRENNGCRLNNYSTCGKAGDIILLQTTQSAGSNSPYDTYLIYDGKNNFFQVQPGGSDVITKGALKPEYASMSYAAMRPGCNK